ncbi:hypothetical protein ACFSDD_06625 [Salipiger marinus]|jgi:ABC-type transporter Mla subunit MlaD|uniref:Cytochrome C oxidase assembly protein n=1 Tax=Salipiger marinus TaxID=555512 RepID=A0A1G8U5H8_9RHOB|nr:MULTISPECIES: hypothetical protein [Salipiger]HBM59364.1 hypothetical protein [Citreicella sp.]MCD1620704.1 hypothetical protein [Salipiger manganoxidans]MEB3421832.1 hypothetical protein [Salipiger manganoxidans]SDJ49018.1 hypothetical protein SAMN04487993_103617 [Salipiger marinus]HBS99855.1 hypothetical protein [Citreicella sp.]|tara:strand:- start:748 stop:936 length:189 start_codon:yes stop_codon:yes gene_type:complete
MSIAREHELHHRRRGRNIGVGLILGALIALVFGLTLVKIGRGDFAVPQPGAAVQMQEAPNDN